MEPIHITGSVFGIVGVALAAVGAYQQSKGHDGSGWAVVALIFLVTMCNTMKAGA